MEVRLATAPFRTSACAEQADLMASAAWVESRRHFVDGPGIGRNTPFHPKGSKIWRPNSIPRHNASRLEAS